MGFMKWKRIRQVIKYGWIDAGEISKYPNVKKSRISIFLDILHCFRRHYIFSNQYKGFGVWDKTEIERSELGDTIGGPNMKRDEWIDDYYENRRFLNKYASRRYETSPKLIQKRQKAYTKRYKLGDNCTIQFNVEFSREHQLNGTLKVGNNVVFAKNVFIDYSGDVEISDHAILANGVNIESHSHTSDGLSTDDAIKSAKPTKLLIEDWVSVGAHCTILETCNRIGRGARIGAGSVIRADVPPYAIVTGNPAKIVGFVFTPGILEEFEEEKYAPEERIPIDEYTDNYNKFFLQRISTIKEYISI